MAEQSFNADEQKIYNFAHSGDDNEEEEEEEEEKEEEGDKGTEDTDEEVMVVGTKIVTPESDLSRLAATTNIKQEVMTKVGTNHKPATKSVNPS